MVQGNSNSVNQIDRMTGYLNFTNGGPADTAADGGLTRVTQDELCVRGGSLLGKATVAQTVFNNKFLLPFSPERPPFFLVPGDNQVTILWSKSRPRPCLTRSLRSPLSPRTRTAR